MGGLASRRCLAHIFKSFCRRSRTRRSCRSRALPLAALARSCVASSVHFLTDSKRLDARLAVGSEGQPNNILCAWFCACSEEELAVCKYTPGGARSCSHSPGLEWNPSQSCRGVGAQLTRAMPHVMQSLAPLGGGQCKLLLNRLLPYGVVRRVLKEVS